jgi:hypothetical protein
VATSPATWLDQTGRERLVGFLSGDFGGLPTGWTQAGDPADVDSNGGGLTLGDLEVDGDALFDGSTVTSNADVTVNGDFNTGASSTATFGADATVTGELDAGSLGASPAYVHAAAAAPTTYVTPIYYDSTAVTGGLYAWNGSAYVQIGNLIA